MTFDGLGSMSAMLVIMTVITIGAVMALRNKMRQNAGINKIYKEKLDSMEKQFDSVEKDTPRTEESDVQDLLDNLKKELDSDDEKDVDTK